MSESYKNAHLSAKGPAPKSNPKAVRVVPLRAVVVKPKRLKGAGRYSDRHWDPVTGRKRELKKGRDA